MSAEVPQNEGHYKKFKNLNKHSQEALRPFFERLSVIASPKKRESELSNLDSLLAGFGPEQIERAIKYVESKGTLRGEACHSPFSYLSLAIADVLKRVERVAVPTIASDAPVSQTQKEGRDAAFRTFEQVLSPAEQELFVRRFIESEFHHGFYPPPGISRSLAAAAWFEQREGMNETVPALEAV